MKLTNTFDYHFQNPDQSLEAYAGRKRLELGRELQSAKKIYLDTKFWLFLRDIRLERRADQHLALLLELLTTLVKKGLAICPISADTFMEVFKQTDSITRRVTVQVIDELSKGVGLLQPEERIQLELLHLVREKTRGAESVHRLDELAWTKVAYVLGFSTPALDDLPAALERAMQKAFLDQMWTITLTDMLDILGSNAASVPRFKDTSDLQNRGKLDNLSDYSSFKQLFLIELASVLEVYKSTLSDLMQYVYESDHGEQITNDESTGKSGDGLASVIYKGFEKNKIKNELPTFRIMAGLHAAVRWDAKRKYKRNDEHDFQHAVAALPYCDFFLTEKSLRHLVNDRNLQFSSFFRCRTFSDISDALSGLTQIGELN